MAVWRVRIAASDTNGGAFDSSISGAGTDYSDSDIPILSLTDLATSGAVATITSAIGGFTAAMVGNAIYIASGTNFTVGTYFILSVTDANTAVLDRVCATGAGSAGGGKVGGALATIAVSYTRSVALNTVMIRGDGTTNPPDIHFAGPNSALSDRRLIGYNGYPKISHIGQMIYAGTGNLVMNCYFIQTQQNILGGVISSADNVMVNCVLDSGGHDCTQVSNASAINCTIMNSGARAQGTQVPVVGGSYQVSTLKNLLIKDQRFSGLSAYPSISNVENIVVQNCLGDGIKLIYVNGVANVLRRPLAGCTVYNCTGHGIVSDSKLIPIIGNSIHSINGSGKYGIYITGTADSMGLDEIIKRNNIYNCANPSNVTLPSSNTALDPQFVNAPSDLTPTNTGLRYLDGIGALM